MDEGGHEHEPWASASLQRHEKASPKRGKVNWLLVVVTAVGIYMSILDKYGIDDMVIGIGTGNSDQNQAMINQEYRSYVTLPYSMQSSNPLKFWEVGALMLVEHYWQDMLDQPVDVSNFIFNGNGLSSNPSISHFLQESILLERWNGYEEEESP